jgi:hypothetical protein
LTVAEVDVAAEVSPLSRVLRGERKPDDDGRQAAAVFGAAKPRLIPLSR